MKKVKCRYLKQNTSILQGSHTHTLVMLWRDCMLGEIDVWELKLIGIVIWWVLLRGPYFKFPGSFAFSVIIVSWIFFSFSQKVASLRSRVDAAPIPAPKKADLRTKISLLQVLQLGLAKTLIFYGLICLFSFSPSMWMCYTLVNYLIPSGSS